MDKKPAVGKREHIRKAVTAVPTLLFTDDSGRDAVVMYNDGPQDVKIGHSGTVATLGMTLAAYQGFTDNYSKDAWWGITVTSSGTISGFKVIS